ncbi:MAG TPA: aldehyde ferredoxin oxidoreductase family protein [Candidatus Limnocylindrales bacterium]|nr:aldehyde ferredoxin oxidoreductase family protein [Candidatus Limnocylindrales bacterium]
MTRLLHINLDTRKVDIDRDDNLRQEYLGGLGINSRLVFDRIPVGADPLGPENVLIFGSGSLAGTLLPTACRTDVCAKSPLSGLFGTANAGGEWGPQLRYAGYDHLILTGKAAEPVYIIINDDQLAIEPAKEIWGQDVWAATDWLKKKHGQDVHVAVIGPAGENQVRFASIQNDFASWGRTGMGAVMGSKNVKAVLVRGTGGVAVADRGAFSQLHREAFRRVKTDPSYGLMRRFGSMVVSDPINALGALPGHNFSIGHFPDWEETCGRKVFETKFKKKDVACFSCPIACAHWSQVKDDGLYKNYQTKGLEVTFVLEFGAKLGLKKIPEIFQCVELCNRHGMDVVSAAGTLAYLTEAFQHGAIDKKDIGFAVKWGDFYVIKQLLEMISRRQGIGDILAEGVRRAVWKLPGTEPFAMHVKGVELSVRDPRAKMDVWSLGYLTNTRGGDSLRTRSPVETLLGKLLDHQTEELGVDASYIANMDMPERFKTAIFGEPPTGVNIPAMTVYAENLISIINSVGFCIRPPVLRSLGPDFYARALNAVYGDDFDEDGVYAAGQRIWDLQHNFNQREGESLSDYEFPSRFYKEPLPGKNLNHPPLERQEVLRNIREYMKIRGY